MKRDGLVWITVLTVVLVLTGCGMAPGSPSSSAAEAMPTIFQEPTDPPTPLAQADSTPAAEPATPTARAGLQATDPTTVDLAAGTPTLVEFFAFW